ncbi:MAG TPA: DUF1028 domain-containing protein, partial [Anaerolineales bacterium]
QFGAAVQTCNLAVGTWVPWAAGGIGVVATQALAERSYGTRGLELMRAGKSAPETLKALLSLDPKPEMRQVSMIDAAGNIATHTGRCCIAEAGVYIGDAFCTQSNMAASDRVWTAMAEAYQEAKGDFATRLLNALDAAEAAGGDLRGKQTAALLIVDSQPSDIPLIDLRVDHDVDPLGQLRRLLRLHQAYMLEIEINAYADGGDTEPVYELIQKIGQLAPDEPYLKCLRALHLVRVLGRREEALSLLRPLVEEAPVWLEYLKRELRSGQETACPGFDPQLLAELDPVAGSQKV